MRTSANVVHAKTFNRVLNIIADGLENNERVIIIEVGSKYKSV